MKCNSDCPDAAHRSRVDSSNPTGPLLDQAPPAFAEKVRAWPRYLVASVAARKREVLHEGSRAAFSSIL